MQAKDFVTRKSSFQSEILASHLGPEMPQIDFKWFVHPGLGYPRVYGVWSTRGLTSPDYYRRPGVRLALGQQ